MIRVQRRLLAASLLLSVFGARARAQPPMPPSGHAEKTVQYLNPEYGFVLTLPESWPPEVLARNEKYVFALPSRYSNDELAGVDEVRRIMKGNPLAPIKLQGGASTDAVRPIPHYAIFSPSIIARIPSLMSTPVAGHILDKANEYVDANPDPLSRVHTKGTLSGNKGREKSLEAEKDWQGMLALGLAYRLTGDSKYVSAADRYLAAWSAIYVVSYSPIDETHMSEFMLAYDLTTGGLAPETEQKVSALWRRMAEGYIKAMEGHHKDDRNLYSHRAKLAVMAAYETGDPDLEARAAKAFRQHVAKNIKPDGSVEDFYKRDALYYVTYDLDPLEMAALAAQSHGEDWFHTGDDGRTLDHAINWLVPYSIGLKTHQEFVHSSESFDAKRRSAGESGFSGQWNPKKSLDTLALAALMDSRYVPALRTCMSNTHEWPAEWIRLLPIAPSNP